MGTIRSALLWHSGSNIGNDYGLAWHVPIGGTQKPTAKQLVGLWQTIDALRLQFSIPRSAVVGHKELKPTTACPGDPLMAVLKQYRSLAEDQAKIYRALVNARVRVLPDVSRPVANGGKAVVIKGSTFACTGIVRGADYEQSNLYVRLSNGLGYIHASLVERVK